VRGDGDPQPALPALLARLHHDFIRIHPFDDGNGRVVRLLLNYVLLRAGLLPMVIKSRDRRRYLDVIALADAGDQTPLAEFLAEAMRWSLRLGLDAASRLIELEAPDAIPPGGGQHD
jgi:Fic family protein